MTLAPEAECKIEIEKDPLDEAYPERTGYKRRVAPLWGPYFRVNYIDTETGEIPYSYFVMVKDGKARQVADN